MRSLSCLLLILVLTTGIAAAQESTEEVPETIPEATAEPTEDSAASGPQITALGEDVFVTIAFDGADRDFLLHVPPSADDGESLPLVVILHGATMLAEDMASLIELNALADQEGFLVVYPQSVDGYWNNIPGASDGGQADDVGFVQTIIEQVSQRYSVADDQIYAAGFSNGGVMTYRLACEIGDQLAAIAVVAGMMLNTQAQGCTDAEPIPLLIVHGTGDQVLPWEGAVRFGEDQFGDSAGVEIWFSPLQAAEFWAGLAGCVLRPQLSVLPDRDANDGTREAEYDYPGCADGNDVALLEVIGGGHTWPGGASAGQPGDSADFSTSEVMWAFFAAHTNESFES
jgi:polyhydroxybutyrate depolymerase